MLRIKLAEDEGSIVKPIRSSVVVSETIKDTGRIEIYGYNRDFFGSSISDIDRILDNRINNELFTFLFSLGYDFEFFPIFNPATIHQELKDRNVSAVVVNEDTVGTLNSFLLFDPDKFPDNVNGILLSSSWPVMPFRSFWLSRKVKHILSPGVKPLELINAIGEKPVEPIPNIPFNINIPNTEVRIPLATDHYEPFQITVPTGQPEQNYAVSLSVQNIPVLSICVPVPNQGNPPFSGLLKVNIGVATVSGEHVVALVGVGGGFTRTDFIKFIAR